MSATADGKLTIMTNKTIH